MRLDADIRRLAEAAQVRRRAASVRVAQGELKHTNFFSPTELYEGALRNLEQMAGEERCYTSLSDVVNYGLALLARTEQPDNETGGG